MTTTQLFITLALAKISGILGVVLMFMQRRTLAGSFLALDAILLVVIVLSALKSMKHLFAEPYEEKPYLW